MLAFQYLTKDQGDDLILLLGRAAFLNRLWAGVSCRSNPQAPTSRDMTVNAANVKDGKCRASVAVRDGVESEASAGAGRCRARAALSSKKPTIGYSF